MTHTYYTMVIGTLLAIAMLLAVRMFWLHAKVAVLLEQIDQCYGKFASPGKPGGAGVGEKRSECGQKPVMAAESPCKTRPPRDFCSLRPSHRR